MSANKVLLEHAHACSCDVRSVGAVATPTVSLVCGLALQFRLPVVCHGPKIPRGKFQKYTIPICKLGNVARLMHSCPGPPGTSITPLLSVSAHAPCPAATGRGGAEQPSAPRGAVRGVTALALQSLLFDLTMSRAQNFHVIAVHRRLCPFSKSAVTVGVCV